MELDPAKVPWPEAYIKAGALEGVGVSVSALRPSDVVRGTLERQAALLRKLGAEPHMTPDLLPTPAAACDQALWMLGRMLENQIGAELMERWRGFVEAVLWCQAGVPPMCLEGGGRQVVDLVEAFVIPAERRGTSALFFAPDAFDENRNVVRKATVAWLTSQEVPILTDGSSVTYVFNPADKSMLVFDGVFRRGLHHSTIAEEKWTCLAKVVQIDVIETRGKITALETAVTIDSPDREDELQPLVDRCKHMLLLVAQARVST